MPALVQCTSSEVLTLPLGSLLDGIILRSWADFQLFRQSHETTLGAIYLHQRAVAAMNRSDVITMSGLCAVCGVPTSFTSSNADGEALPGGGREPNWREVQNCACELGLNMRERALLHAWLRMRNTTAPADVLLLGDMPRVAEWLRRRGHVVMSIRHAAEAGTAGSIVDALLSAEHLDLLADLAGELTQLHGLLRPGGQFLFTSAFHYDRAETRLAADDGGVLLPDAQRHALAWDVLDMLGRAGFRDPHARLIWSTELGYLGSVNLVLEGHRA